MSTFDYDAEAELFPGIGRSSRRQPVGYRRFAKAAEALRFAIEELAPEALAGAALEVGDQRFDSRGIRRLYESSDYPLVRRKLKGHPPAAARAASPRSGRVSGSSQERGTRGGRS